MCSNSFTNRGINYIPTKSGCTIKSLSLSPMAGETLLWIKLGLLVLLTGIIITGYGGLCGSSVNDISSGSSITSPQRPSVTTNSATNITFDFAILNGTVNPNGFNTRAYFQWGKTKTYGNIANYHHIIDAGMNNVNVSVTLTELSWQTIYHFRLAATNSNGTSYGRDQSFTMLIPVNLPSQVTSPNPDNEARNVSIYTQLSWAYVSGASSYDVYFGTDTKPSLISANTTQRTYKPPGKLFYSTSYYWRIDSKNSVGTTMGNVWTFNTQPPPPQPSNGATNISINTQLSWAAVRDAVSYDVYFGTTKPPPYVANITQTTYSPNTLLYNTIYYWQVNSTNPSGTTTGDVWCFTTGSEGWAQVSAGYEYTLALKTDGTLWVCGSNDYGQLGDGTTDSKYVPTRISGTNWSAIAAGYYHTVALKSNGTLWTWGYNWYGQLGDGTLEDKYEPTQIGTDSNWSMIAAGMHHTIAIKLDGTLWEWGGNQFGQLGDGTTIPKTLPTQITGTDWSAVAAGLSHTIALKLDGTLWVWGRNTYGQLGDGTIKTKTVPTQITGTDWSTIAAGDYHTIAIKNDGTLWVWGRNTYGQLGDGTLVNKNVPTQIGIDTNWSKVVAGISTNGESHTIALKTDSTLWAWGWNNWGQLGDGTWVDKNVPTQIGIDANWSIIKAGGYHTIAIKLDGTLWGWGKNISGQLGLGPFDGTGINKNVPTQIWPVKYSAKTTNEQ